MAPRKKPRIGLEPPDPISGGKRIWRKQAHPTRPKKPKHDEAAESVGVAPDDGGSAGSVADAPALLLPEVAAPVRDAAPSSSSDSDSSDSDAEEPGAPEEKGEEEAPDDSDARRCQFGGTWAHTAAPGLKKPADMSKEEFGSLFLSLAKEAYKSDQTPGHPPNRLQRVAVVEGGTWPAGEVCYDFGLLSERQFYPAALKRLFRQKHGIALSFTAVHNTYWATFVQMTVPSGAKPLSALDPEPWLSPGHPSVSDTLHLMPPKAYFSEKARVRAFLGLSSQGRPPPAAQAPDEAGAEQEQEEADADGYRRQYLGTWSHTDLPGLRKPADLTKEQFGDLLLAVAKEHFVKTKRPGARRNQTLKAAVVEEPHQSGEMHKQFAFLADKPFASGGMKRLFREKHNIALHFSDSHDYYWTTFVYITVPSDKKPVSGIDPEPWLSPGHPPVADALLEIPPGASRSDKIRVRAFLGLDARGRPLAGSEAERPVGEVEFSALVTALGLRTRGKLLAFIARNKALPVPEEDQATAEQNKRLMQQAKGLSAFVHRHLRDLAERMHLAWELHDAVEEEARAAMSAWETVLAASEKMRCVCGGHWGPLTEDMLGKQVATGAQKGVPENELPRSANIRAALRTALKEGCGKYQNVFIIGPPNAAKSHLLAPLIAIFGKHSFRRPLGKSNFPMMEIHGKKVCVLEDLRVATFGLGWDAYLVWWEGQPLPVPMPQNQHKGALDYTDKAPVFATAGEKMRIPLREAVDLGLDPQVQNNMMDARWQYFQFRHAFVGEERRPVPACGHCFGKWLAAFDEDVAVVDFF